jgi:hypothetical protein
MAAFVFNVAKGRVVEYYNRVKSNDPAAATLVVAVVATSGLESDAVLKDKDTFAAVVSGTTNWVTNSGYAKKVLADADLAALPSPDDTADLYAVDIPDQTWTSVAAGDGWSKLIIGYDPSSSGVTDSVIIPLTCHDFTATPNGGNITAQINASGFFSAS